MLRRLKMSRMFVAAVFMLTALAVQGQAYIVDGLLDDWGVNLALATNKGYLDCALPSGGNDIDVLTEDNAAANIYGWQYVGPGYSYGDNDPQSPFYQAGNTFDLEAIYFDNDQTYAYIAIVQGMPITGGGSPGNPWLLPGDIAIDADNDPNTGTNGFELGLNISNSHLYAVDSWQGVYYPTYSSANPWAIASGTDLGLVEFIYGSNQNSHYVLEAKIPLSMLNLTYGDYLNIHWTQQCGNDYLNLRADVNPPVPEPLSAGLLLTGMVGVFGFRKKLKK